MTSNEHTDTDQQIRRFIWLDGNKIGRNDFQFVPVDGEDKRRGHRTVDEMQQITAIFGDVQLESAPVALAPGIGLGVAVGIVALIHPISRGDNRCAIMPLTNSAQQDRLHLGRSNGQLMRKVGEGTVVAPIADEQCRHFLIPIRALWSMDEQGA